MKIHQKKKKFYNLVESNVYFTNIKKNINQNNYSNNLKSESSNLYIETQTYHPNYTINKNTEFSFINTTKKNNENSFSPHESNNDNYSVNQILPSFHNNKFYQNLNEKISLNSERKIIFNQTITNFERNQEFTIINSPVKKRSLNHIKFNFYDWEKNKMKNRYNSVSHNYLQIQKEKEEKNKRKFFDGLILYSNLKKVIDITDKIIYSEKFCTLTENEFNVYKNIGEFITLQKPYISILKINIKNVNRISISSKNEIKGEHLIYFGIKYENLINEKTEVLFFASNNEKLISKWINILNRE